MPLSSNSAGGASSLARLWRPRVQVGAASNSGTSARARLTLVLLIALAQGLMYMLVLPPWQHYEEPTHFEYAWLIANRGHIPVTGEFDPAMRRDVAASMLAYNFYANLLKPDLAGDGSAIWIGGAEVGLQPPAYYILVSMPLRLLRHLDITSQLYVARAVSLILFVLTIGAASGMMSDLTPRAHPLRWAVPLFMALLPAFADLMTAVNNDAGATAVFSLLLWGCVRCACRGVTWRRLLWVAGMTLLGAQMKATAVVAIVLLPFALLMVLWIEQGWRWRWFAAAILALLLISTIALFSWSDSAFWRRWPTPVAQDTSIRVTSVSAPFGSHAIAADVLTSGRNYLLVNTILTKDSAPIAGQTVTVGGWMWADRSAFIPAPGLRWVKRGATKLDGQAGERFEATTTPTFVAQTFSIPQQIGSLHYALFGNVETPDGQPLRIFLDGAIVIAGEFPAGTTPSFDDETGRTGRWAGIPFVNLVRNPSGEQGSPRFRPWAERALAPYTHISPTRLLNALWDVQRHLPILIYGLVDWVPIGFFAAFAWSNVRLAGAGWLMLFQAAILVALAGCVKWCVNARPRTFVWVALVLLASAALLVWGVAVALPLVDDWGLGNAIPTVRYTFPAIIPTVLALAGGWCALWPRAYRVHGAIILLAALVALDAVAVSTIQLYYQSLPST